MMRVIEKRYSVEHETFDSVFEHWKRTGNFLSWNCPFVLPVWLKTWWNVFSRNDALYLQSVQREGRTIGISPLQRSGETVRFIGDGNVCDHLDFIVDPENSTEFYSTLLNDLKRDGVKRLELESVRRDSSAMMHLLPVAEKIGFRVSYKRNDTSFELALPGSWEDYLTLLSGKARHEIRRKFRRLKEAGQINYRLVDDASSVKKEIETFLELFRSNRSDKAGFMNDRMASFFRILAETLNEERILQLFFLDLDERPVAAFMCFSYHSTMYLYNNGYDKRFGYLSVGLLGKALSIRESIQSGKKTYDFLKGAEEYKKRLGGHPVQLYRCLIE